MRFTKISLSFGPSNTIEFPIDDTITTSPFVIKAVAGLDPPQIAVSISDLFVEGGYFQAKRPANREVVMTIGFQPNYGVGQNSGDLREQLYSLLSPKNGAPVTLSLYNGATFLANVTGYVRNLAATIFDKDPAVQITIACTSPYLLQTPYVHPFPSTVPKAPVTIVNPGTAPIGFRIRIVPTVSLLTFSLTNETSTEIFSVTATSNMTTSSKLTIDTSMGKRAVFKTQSSVDTNFLPFLSADSTWLQLHPGTNIFYPSTASFNIDLLEFTPRLWGV